MTISASEAEYMLDDGSGWRVVRTENAKAGFEAGSLSMQSGTAYGHWEFVRLRYSTGRRTEVRFTIGRGSIPVERKVVVEPR